MPHDLHTEMLAHRGNPYASNTDAWPEAIPDPVVLTIRDLDRLVAGRLAEADRHALDRERRACAKAWEEGRAAGQQDGYRDGIHFAIERVTGILNGRLNHILRRLNDRADAPKSTIARERAAIASEARELDIAIRDLRAVGS